MSKATERLLHLFEIVANEGPIGLADLTSASGISRSAAHRAVQVLEAQGWVRARLFDHSYEVSSKFDQLMAEGLIALEEVEMLAPFMKEVASRKNFASDVGLFVRTGQFEILESTDRSQELNSRCSLISSDTGMAAQLALSPINQVRHLNAFMGVATDEEQELVTSGTHRQRLNELQVKGMTAFPDKVILPFESANKVGGALVIRSKRRGRLYRMELRELAERGIDTLYRLELNCPFSPYYEKQALVG